MDVFKILLTLTEDLKLIEPPRHVAVDVARNAHVVSRVASPCAPGQAKTALVGDAYGCTSSRSRLAIWLMRRRCWHSG